MKKYLFSLLALIVLVSNGLLGQQSSQSQGSSGETKKQKKVQKYTADLSSNVRNFTYTVKRNDTIQLTIINLLPNTNSKGQYTINQSIAVSLPPPLTTPTGDAHAQEVAPAYDCVGLKKTVDGSQSEADFGKNMQTALANCPQLYQDYYKASTIVKKFNGLHNEILTLTITNTITNTTWTIVFQPEDEGQFVTVYGFTFIPYLFSKQKTYFAQTTPTAGTYMITPAYSESIADYAPTLAFHYVSRNANDWSGSWTAGLGVAFNTSSNSGISPVVVGGYSLLYHTNFGINFGVASDLVSNLKGQYQKGQLITTNLQPSDLNEKVIGFNPFISVIFRFGSSPFSAKPANVITAGQDVTPVQPTQPQPTQVKPSPPM